jgi:rhomboid family GlyGly-CTERM serine protease
MQNKPLPISIVFIFIGAAIILLAAFEQHLFSWLCLESTKVSEGQLWRLITGNFVHFGWAHTAMNLLAFLLCTFAFFSDYSTKIFLLLILTCSLFVGLCIFFLNPEYTIYAGLSGVIHGLLIYGILASTHYPKWIQLSALILIGGKLIHENMPGYEATDLQNLIPAAVAVESHVYGAIGGFVFFILHRLHQRSYHRPHL